MTETSEIVKQAHQLQGRIAQAMEQLDLASDAAQLARLHEAANASNLWEDPTKATAVTRDLAQLQKHIDSWQGLLNQARELTELSQLHQAEATQDTDELEQLANQLTDLRQTFETRETELKLAGPYDKNSAIVSIYAGTGGTDAQDWAEMLERMYLRWSEKAGFNAQILSLSAGEEAGIKSLTMEINGAFAFGYLKSEKGVHRLVRLSPYNADSLRQTSFALVDVIPQIDLPAEAEIDPKDLRIDVYRSGGHGGQSVNTTDSAVRITHIPTGLVVAIQNERSQLQNKQKAMAVLSARLANLMAEQHQERLSDLRGQVHTDDWGHQIRSYVLHPYTKVKDHRTGHETSDAQGVLDGNLEPFIEAYLQQGIGSPN